MIQAVFESSTDSIFIWDRNYNYLYANPVSLAHAKTTRDNIIGRNIREGRGHTPEFVRLWISRIDRVFETGEILRVEDTIPVGDRLVHSQSILLPIRHSDGRIFAVGAVYRDVTEQKQMKAALQESEIRFTRMVENAGEGILVADIHTHKFIYANPRICHMLGYTCDELLQLGIRDIHPKEWYDTVMAAFENIVQGGKTSHERPCLRKDGSVIYARISGAAYEQDGNRLAVGFFTDISEQKKLEHKLAENEKLYRELYDRVRIPLFRTRIGDGKLLECNAAMVRFLGYTSKEECLREHYSTRQYADPSKRTALLARLKQEGFVNNFEIEFVRHDGTHAWVEVSAQYYPDEGYIEGAHLDITARKVLSRAEKETLALILQGHTNKEIGKQLSRSVRTVEGHRASIMRKLNVNSLAELLYSTQFFIPETP